MKQYNPSRRAPSREVQTAERIRADWCRVSASEITGRSSVLAEEVRTVGKRRSGKTIPVSVPYTESDKEAERPDWIKKDGSRAASAL